MNLDHLRQAVLLAEQLQDVIDELHSQEHEIPLSKCEDDIAKIYKRLNSMLVYEESRRLYAVRQL